MTIVVRPTHLSIVAPLVAPFPTMLTDLYYQINMQVATMFMLATLADVGPS